VMEAGEVPISIGRVKLMMQEEFDRRGFTRLSNMKPFCPSIPEITTSSICP